jgi:Epoxide hydrolase N terminus
MARSKAPETIDQDRRRLLGTATMGIAVAAAASLLPSQLAASTGDAIRPFRVVDVPEEQLVDLRRRVLTTRWPDRETVNDRSQGEQLAKFQNLVRYWGTDYDWRKAEAKLNALPQFMTTIDDVDIHFIHVRSRHPNAMPLIMTHGWPGSVFELLRTVGPLTDPTAHGGLAEDAFDLVLPSMPGYGFSGKPKGTGWDPDHIARAWAELMKRLEYTRYVAQGGDWGAPSPARWRARRRQDCSASTSTCRRRYRRRWPRCSTRAGPRRRDSPRRNARRSTRSTRPARKGTGPTS